MEFFNVYFVEVQGVVFRRCKGTKKKLKKSLQELKTGLYLHSQLCNGLVVQLVRIPACHAGGREFESRPDRKCENSSIGRASVFQTEGREFESHFSLKYKLNTIEDG